MAREGSGKKLDQADPREVIVAALRLFHAGAPAEISAKYLVGKREWLTTGVWCNYSKAADAILALDKEKPAPVAVWHGLHNVKTSDRAVDRWSKGGRRKAGDVVSRAWFFVDSDRREDDGRKSETWATEAELAECRTARDAVVAFFSRVGLPAPVLVASANGFQAFVPLADLEKTDALEAAIMELHALLDERLGTPAAKIDTQVSDLPRVAGIPGTLSRKFAGTPRRVRFETDPATYTAQPVTLELLLHAIAQLKLLPKREGASLDPLPLEVAPIAEPAPAAMVAMQNGTDHKPHLLDFAGKDTKLRAHAEGESCGKCSFPGCTSKDDGFVVFHNEGIERRNGLKFEGFTGRFLCRKCKRKGDAADYLMMRHGMYRAQALQALGLERPPRDAESFGFTAADQGNGFALTEPWEDPVTFDAPLALPAIPTEALPPILAEFVREVAASFEVHTDLPAACVLGVAAAACQKKYRVHVHGDHYEPMNASLLPVAPPGDRKSAVLPFVLAPLFDYEDFLRERDKGEVERAIANHKVAAARREYLQKKAATAKEPDDRDEATRELQELVATATDPPVLPMLTVGADVTAEALATILNQHGGRITICDAEGGRLFGNVGGHYSNGSPNLEVLLAGHAGDLLKVHRKSGGEIVVKHPAVTTILAVQPDVVRTLAGVFKARGLAGRFLYVFPQPMAGHRKFNGQAVRADVRDAYNATIRAVLELEPARGEDGSERAHLLKFTADAYEVQREMSRATDRQMLPGEPLAEMTDWGSKAAGAAARIAGLLHVLEHAQHGQKPNVRSVRFVPISAEPIESTLSLSENSTSTARDSRTERTITTISPCSCGGRPEAVGICPPTVLSAWDITTCLKEHARHAYALMAADAEGEFSREILAWLKDRKPTGTKADDGLEFVDGKITVFSKRALHRRFRKREDRDAALRVLEEMGYCRRMAGKNAAGRPSEKYEVCPKWAR